MTPAARVLLYVLGEYQPTILATLPRPIVTVASTAEYWRRFAGVDLSVLSLGGAVDEGLRLMGDVRKKHPSHRIVIVARLEPQVARKLVTELSGPNDLVRAGGRW